MSLIAHVGGVPVEEILRAATGGVAGLLLARGWIVFRLRGGREPGK